LIEKVSEKLRLIYKTTIRKNLSILENMKDKLNDREKLCMKYINFNPSMCLILDDVTSELPEWCKDKAVLEMFYQGRWFWMTFFCTVHADTKVPPEIRSNAFNSIFTSSEIAMQFFTNTKNSFPLAEKKKVQVICNELFKVAENGMKNNKKFIYSREDEISKFRYCLASKVKPRLGSTALWKLCDEIPDEETKTSTSKFSRLFNTE